MKKLFAIIFFCLSSSYLFGQITAQEALIKLSAAIQKLENVSYDRAFEIHNSEENYFHKDTSTLYLEFNSNYPADLYRLIRSGEKFKWVFTQENNIYFSTSKETFEMRENNISGMQIYQSLLDLRVSLPKILKEENIHLKLKDTSISQTIFYNLELTLPPSVIMKYPEGLGRLGIPTIVSTYTFVLDKNTFLPYLLLYINTNNANYFVKNYFLNYNLQPTPPKASEWTLEGYPTYTKYTEEAKNEEIKPGEAFPKWELPQFPSQNVLTNDDTKGKITVLEFWVKNCGYCQMAFEDMKELSEKYKDSEVNIFSINMDDTDTIKDLAFIYNKNQPIYTMLHKGENLAKSVGIYSYPRTIILDENGKVILHNHGFNYKKVDDFLKGRL